jgi:hypothetical protein
LFVALALANESLFSYINSDFEKADALNQVNQMISDVVSSGVVDRHTNATFKLNYGPRNDTNGNNAVYDGEILAEVRVSPFYTLPICAERGNKCLCEIDPRPGCPGYVREPICFGSDCPRRPSSYPFD